jgi:hypothetical protein
VASEFVIGLVGGSLTTALGFGLQVARDEHRRWRDQRQQDLLVVRALRREAERNVAALVHGRLEVQAEVAAIAASKALVGPLVPIQRGAVDVLRGHIPAGLSQQLLDQVLGADFILSRVAATMAYRDQWRLSGGSGHRSYLPGLAEIDELLLANIDETLGALEPARVALVALEQQLAAEPTFLRYYREAGQLTP